VLQRAAAADAEVAAGGFDAMRAWLDDADDVAAVSLLLDRDLLAFQRIGHEGAIGGLAVALVADAEDVNVSRGCRHEKEVTRKFPDITRSG
jgi:hypothetical protein